MRCARAKNRSSEDKESYLRPQNLLSSLETKTRMAREEVVEKIVVFLSTPPQNCIFSGKKVNFLFIFPCITASATVLCCHRSLGEDLAPPFCRATNVGVAALLNP